MRKRGNGNHQRNGNHRGIQRNDETAVLSLSMVQEGEVVRIVSFRGGRGIQNRLFALGLIPGTKIVKIKDNHDGPAIVRVKNSRLAIGRGLLHRIEVEYINKEL